MTIGECIEKYKHNDKIKQVWICPDIVRDSKIGKNYVFNGSISSKLDTALLNSPVAKYWKEDSCLCIVYTVTNCLFTFAVTSS